MDLPKEPNIRTKHAVVKYVKIITALANEYGAKLPEDFKTSRPTNFLNRFTFAYTVDWAVFFFLQKIGFWFREPILMTMVTKTEIRQQTQYGKCKMYKIVLTNV